ncbi:KAP family P-loop NTPase fold protein [Variovorax sp. DAIF25]|uniref:KAP family P-loop NTPase fold protein n=1 Tax=Variovorax sp. DAIF25 TaxID=3080983 RepID=UPI003D6C0A31
MSSTKISKIEDSNGISIGLDLPLQAGSALRLDKFGRVGFAKSAAEALRRITSNSGFVLSIEGAWGSGKTSALAMIEELLGQGSKADKPVIVHFNPWLIGDRDALLRHFLSKLATAAKLTDHAKNGKKAAKELKTYAKAFDVMKLIPGAEPWASMIKSVVLAVGETTEEIAEYKTPDIEVQKTRVEEALEKLTQPIVIFVDDIDRLYPLEVFEMIRIIKAVGGLPNVGYVIALDPAYVGRALQSASVPQADNYLDKVVQLRMPLPGMSLSSRRDLVNEALGTLHPDASASHFSDSEDRIAMLYFSGLRELLEQPRDVTRVFNTVRVIEPELRGEVVLSDIVGLATLMVKASPVFELLSKQPSLFVGRLPSDLGVHSSGKDIIKNGRKKREEAYEKCSSSAAVKRLVHRLFPLTANAEEAFVSGQISGVKGHIADPARLLVALQLSTGAADVSFVAARQYLHHPSKRGEIESALTSENGLAFLESLGDVAASLEGKGVADLLDLCLSIARLIDARGDIATARGHFRADTAAVRAISSLVETAGAGQEALIAEALVKDDACLSIAMHVIAMSSLGGTSKSSLQYPSSKGKALQHVFAENCLKAAQNGRLLEACASYIILWHLPNFAKGHCQPIFKTLRDFDSSLDSFVLCALRDSFDSYKGQIFALGAEEMRIEAYVSLAELKRHGESRLADATLTLPAKAAWRALVEGKRIYGKDGSLAEG